MFSFAIEKNSILDAEDLKTILWEKGLKSNQITVQKDSDSSLDYIFDIECDADSPEGLFESIRKSLRPVKELFKDYYIHPSYFSYYVKEQGLGLST